MRNNQFTFILVGILFLCTLWTAGQFLRLRNAVARAPETQINSTAYQQYTQRIIPQMLTDMAEYSKKNPAIDKLLETYGIRVDRSAAAK